MHIFADYRINIVSGELGGDSGDKVYLAAPGMLDTQYRAIEQSLLRVWGLKRVRRIDLIPSERRHFELDTLLRHVAEPVLSVDREGRVIAANLAAARAFGVSLDRVPGLQLQRFLPLLQVAPLLRDFTVPRYGIPVTLRGRGYHLEWTPIAVADSPGQVESLAGAVLTMQAVPAPGPVFPAPDPVALWDFDLRRDCCLKLQELASLNAPLLIRGERGSGKSTFASASHHLSPLAASGECVQWRLADGDGQPHWPRSGTVIIEDLERLTETQQLQLARQLPQLPVSLRIVATCRHIDGLAPVLVQFFSGLTLQLPPLRNMRPALARFAETLLRTGEGVSGELQEVVTERLAEHDWPDNFAGLRDFLLAASSACRRRGGAAIQLEDLPDLQPQTLGPWREWARGLGYRDIMDRVERELLQDLCRGCHSTRDLARRLGISHTAVANKLRKHGLTPAR
ncbi:TyrR/PhhR family helix-turn-helix DNA-binding protein [Microbulbifer discodermiae]|uniref:TyrR/PhhR family helix-turn-helix DNA-binding protein n=1 Tax=Microbulbifer sp. 2201CG32-9 TaxID=3232309 RepID=UPI00345BA05D